MYVCIKKKIPLARIRINTLEICVQLLFSCHLTDWQLQLYLQLYQGFTTNTLKMAFELDIFAQ